ncbi:hypothetical protein D0N36_11365 [Hymenobacter lapidiphilus]|nr:hypothetical protein D0N36_11365 [Hymenobacter sp. CCM 8763]
MELHREDDLRNGASSAATQHYAVGGGTRITGGTLRARRYIVDIYFVALFAQFLLVWMAQELRYIINARLKQVGTVLFEDWYKHSPLPTAAVRVGTPNGCVETGQAF